MLVALVGAAVAFASAVWVPPAFATTTCSFDPVDGTLSATVANLGTVAVGPGSEIQVDGSPCGSPDGSTATLSNTATIAMIGAASDDLLRVDLTGGAFVGVAWSVDLEDGLDTLAVHGTDDRDALTVGSTGFSLDGSIGSHVAVEAFVLRGFGGHDVLSGAGGIEGTGTLVSGSIVLVGGPGNDRMQGGLGSDGFRGGPGRDLVTYLAHEAAITATLDGLANDGMAGEDFIRRDVENLMGGLGDDHLVGDAGANRLAGAPGSDVLEGGEGRDRLRGEQDDDRLDGGMGDDLLRGGFGEDWLEGDEGRDTLQGDGHADTLRGGSGDDTFLARDGWADWLVGGPGTDTAHVDASDDVTGCERVDAEALRMVPIGEGRSPRGPISAGERPMSPVDRILAGQPHMGVYWLRPGRIPVRGSGPTSPHASLNRWHQHKRRY